MVSVLHSGRHHTHLWLHVILTLLFVELSLLFCGCILVLLILTDQIIHVALGFCEFHFVHALSCVPVKEGFATEHRGEVLGNSLEHFLDGSGVSSKRDRHLQALGRNIAHRCLDVVWNPLHEVRRVLVLDVQHLLIHLLGGHSTTEEGCSSEVTAMTGVSCTHH